MVLVHRLYTFVGCASLPFLQKFAKAPWPARLVPLPFMRGTLATARPVPHPSAECIMPAVGDTPYGWRVSMLQRRKVSVTKVGSILVLKIGGVGMVLVMEPDLL